MLEVCPTIAGGRPSCEIHPLSIGGREDPVRLVFTAPPGPAVIVALLDLGDRFRMVANEVDLVEPDEPLPRLPVARAVWKPQPELATAAEAWLMAGGPHHTVLTTQSRRRGAVRLRRDRRDRAARDRRRARAATPSRSELRWNQAYYRPRPRALRVLA